MPHLQSTRRGTMHHKTRPPGRTTHLARQDKAVHAERRHAEALDKLITEIIG